MNSDYVLIAPYKITGPVLPTLAVAAQDPKI